MAINCEVCGRSIKGPADRVFIDGALLWVCQGCAKRGKPYRAPEPVPRLIGSGPPPTRAAKEPDMDVDPDYYKLVRTAREKLGLTQEQLGRAINVKASVISHVESGKMKPDLALARTLAHHLKVELLVPSAELES